MKLILRTLLWATLLAFPCLWLTGPWQAALARMSELLLAFFRQSVSIDEVQVMAPFDIGLFVALCLATPGTQRGARRRALLLGIPIMIVAEIVVVALGIVPALFTGGTSDPDSRPARLGAYIIESVPWVSALVVWTALLGARHIGPALAAASRTARPGRAAPETRGRSRHA